jgi:uncharacterized alpha-E superfamily protein
MLSRVAERLYWMSRYLERVENTARLLGVYTNLLLDMPNGVNIGWYNLITLNVAESWFDARYKIRDERNVVRFLLSDPDYAGSMVSSLRSVRENIRTSRDVIPEECWEYVNELSLYVNDNLQAGVNRGTRHDFITDVIKTCQQLHGLILSTMSEGQPKCFIRLGRNLERADMTTRLLDAGTALLLENEENLLPSLDQIVWVNVLNSASAHLPFTKSQRKSVKGYRVARYLVEDSNFPRAIAYCLNALTQTCQTLPQNEAVMKSLAKIQRQQYHFDESAEDEPLGQDFRDYLNDFQLSLARLHGEMSDTWFPAD